MRYFAFCKRCGTPVKIDLEHWRKAQWPTPYCPTCRKWQAPVRREHT